MPVLSRKHYRRRVSTIGTHLWFVENQPVSFAFSMLMRKWAYLPTIDRHRHHRYINLELLMCVARVFISPAIFRRTKWVRPSTIDKLEHNFGYISGKDEQV
jgi:hypothetical protein